MNKRHLHHIWRQIRKVRAWYFLVGFVVFAGIATTALRNNNLTALRLRDEVMKVDQQNGDVEAALRELREYMHGHMNTQLAVEGGVYPPIQLKYRYERLVEAEIAKTNSNNTVYADAQTYCEANEPESFYGAGRLTCIQSYIDRQPNTPSQAPNIPDSLYKFDFASPVWSPDLAGWSIVVAGLFGLLFIVRVVVDRWMKTTFRAHL
jgi:hypothetical protein